MIRWGLRTIIIIDTHELDGSSLRLFLTTKLEAKMANETEKQGDKGYAEHTVCIA